jgi:hypothetical protein
MLVRRSYNQRRRVQGCSAAGFQGADRRLLRRERFTRQPAASQTAHAARRDRFPRAGRTYGDGDQPVVGREPAGPLALPGVEVGEVQFGRAPRPSPAPVDVGRWVNLQTYQYDSRFPKYASIPHLTLMNTRRRTFDNGKPRWRLA